MFTKKPVPIPEKKGKILIKRIKNTDYVNYQYDSVYVPEKRYAIPKRTTIGKACEHDSKKMYPNSNYMKFFPENEIPKAEGYVRSSCMKFGSFMVIEKIIHEYSLQGMISKVIGDNYGLFLDLLTYSIICEDNAGQYYPDYAYNHALFTEQMKILSDSTVSDYINSITKDQVIKFLAEWNSNVNKEDKVYISYDSTNKKCQAGDIDVVEVGHLKEDVTDVMFNYAIAYNIVTCQPIFFEKYPGSIVDVSQLQMMIGKVEGYGYKNAGFILDRGYFCKENLNFMDKHGFDYIIMMKGNKSLVSEIVLEKKGTFEEDWSCRIKEYRVSGTTVKRQMFPQDKKERFFHLYYSDYKAAAEREVLERKLASMELVLSEKSGQVNDIPEGFKQYYDPIYYNESKPDQLFMHAMPKKDVINREIKLCGYFVIITSEEMSAKDALFLYKSRDNSEKLFRGDKSYLGNKALRVYSSESLESKVFIEFVALIVRNRIYTNLKDEMKRLNKRYNYMTVPAAISELEKIEMIKLPDGDYRLDHAVTANQKTILKAFNIDTNYVKDRVKQLQLQLSIVDK